MTTEKRRCVLPHLLDGADLDRRSRVAIRSELLRECRANGTGARDVPGEIAVEPLQEATVCRTEIDRVQLRLAKADGAGALVVLPVAVPAGTRHVNALVEENLGEEHLVLEKTSERLVEAPDTLIALPADHEAARVGRRLVSYERNDERRRVDDGVERDRRIEEVIGGPGSRIAGPAVPPLGPAVDHALLLDGSREWSPAPEAWPEARRRRHREKQ